MRDALPAAAAAVPPGCAAAAGGVDSGKAPATAPSQHTADVQADISGPAAVGPTSARASAAPRTDVSTAARLQECGVGTLPAHAHANALLCQRGSVRHCEVGWVRHASPLPQRRTARPAPAHRALPAALPRSALRIVLTCILALGWTRVARASAALKTIEVDAVNISDCVSCTALSSLSKLPIPPSAALPPSIPPPGHRCIVSLACNCNPL